jgi:vanadium chloroperoxidase
MRIMDDAVLYWNLVALEANKESHTHDHGEQTGPPLSARALAIVHLAMYDAFVGQDKVNGGSGTDPHYLPAAELPTATAGGSPESAIAGAAHTALSALFPTQKTNFDTFYTFIEAVGLPGSVTVQNVKDGFNYGKDVAEALLDRRKNDPGASPVGYEPTNAPGKWQPDPDHPGQKAHAPHYGELSKLFATTKRYSLVAPPTADSGNAEYMRAYRQVRSKGIESSQFDSVSDQYDQYTVVAGDTLSAIAEQFYGDPSLWPRIFEANRHRISNPNQISVGWVLRIPTSRTLGETVAGIYWGYDGAVGLGTPPRLYNQIVRQIAKTKNNTLADNARLFALVNVAMADAGILAWEQKYAHAHDYWRPVTGIREHGGSLGSEEEESTTIGADPDPWWLPLGAPNTNTRLREPFDAKLLKNFTPPFPAYPSGHATFGAAALHITRRFYKVASGDRKPDKLFEDAAGDNMGFVSDEFNGVNQDNTGTVRPNYAREFKDGLWGMIEENSRSRVFLGVHWVFDGFAVNASNVPQLNKGVNLSGGVAGVGGVPLGLAIADDIFNSNMLAANGDAAGLPTIAAAGALADGMGVEEFTRLTRIIPRQPWPLG